MAGKQTISGATTVEYLKKHPKMPLLTLGRLMNKENPELYPTAEVARKSLLYYTGKNGGGRSAKAADRYDTKREKGVSGQDVWKDMMPESQHESLTEWRLPKANRKVLVMSDCHLPYHSIEALTIAIEYGIAEGVDGVLLNGDVMDMYSASQHEKDPRKRNFQEELEATRGFLALLRKAFDGKPIWYRFANHERRWERYMMKYAEIMLGTPEFHLHNLLQLGAMGIEHIPEQTPMYLGKLTVLHGDEYRGSGGVNPARWLSLRTGDNCMVGHFHRTSTHVDRTVRGDTRGWWSTGCLCALDPDWLRFTQWNHGFAIVDVNPDGSFEVDNLTIVDGRVR